MKPPQVVPPLEEIVTLALNEQGYLLQHKLSAVLEGKNSPDKSAHNWIIEAEEVPVSISEGRETRVDAVLRYVRNLGSEKMTPWRVVMESKRSSPDFKR